MRLSAFLALAGLLGALLLTAGCVPSQNPLYTDKEIVQNDDFAGAWQDARLQGIIRIEKADDKAYTLSIPPMGNIETSTTLKVHLVKLEDKLFMDAVNTTANDMDPVLNAAHYFSKVKIEKDTLSITALDLEWAKGAITGGSLQIANETRGDKILLTAPTAELQKLALKYIDDAAAYKNGLTMTRVK